MELNLNISPCPNDTFMFDALVNSKINTNGYKFNLNFADIEELNNLAIKGIPHISKISYGVYPQIANSYQLLTSGSALGFGVGPLLISKKQITPEQINSCRIAIPGTHTTANLLLSKAFPNATNKKTILFSEIEEAIINEQVDAGVIIHESRFSYHKRGLKKIIDLGEWWEQTSGLPVPLGGIAIRRDMPTNVKADINNLLQQSINWAFANPDSTSCFVQQHAQEMNQEIQKAHIALYVNQHSIRLQEQDQQAIATLLSNSSQSFNINNIFITP